MFPSNILKIQCKEKRIFKSDNNNTYFTVSNFNNNYDGLWSSGFQLINKIIPENSSNNLESKILFVDNIQLLFHNNYLFNCYLFKDNNGLFIEYSKKKIIKNHNKIHDFIFYTGHKVKILEKNIRNIILEYLIKNRNSSKYIKYFLSISVNPECEILSINKNQNEDKFILKIKPVKKIDKKNFIYITYNKNLNLLKNNLESNINTIDILKSKLNKFNNDLIHKINFHSENKKLNKAIQLLILSSNDFIMKKNNLTGLWAGFPWFNCVWVRDALISIPGICLVRGEFITAKKIIKNISRYQCRNKSHKYYGRIPNVIYNKNNIQYNSIDSTPLYIKTIYEYYLYTNDISFIIKLWDSIELSIENVFYLNKDKNNFIPSTDGETWMDAKINGKTSYSPRLDFAVEIQSLWYTALYCAVNLTKNISKYYKKKKDIERYNTFKKIYIKYNDDALKLKTNFQKYFTSIQEPFIYDSISKDYTPSTEIRPNSMLAIYYTLLPGIPELIDNNRLENAFQFITPKLFYKHGIASLNKINKNFHPVHIHESYNKDAAYHNGVIWLWLSGIFIKIACKLGFSNTAFEHTENLISQILDIGTIGSLSELNDVFKNNLIQIQPSGTYNQAWSVAEFLRSIFQDYIGINIYNSKRIIYFNPKLPDNLNNVDFILNIGKNEKLYFNINLNKKNSLIEGIDIKSINIEKELSIYIKVNLGYNKTKKMFYKYNILLIKLTIFDQDDEVKFYFNQIDENEIKLKKMSILGKTKINSLLIKNKIHSEKLLETFYYADDISLEEFHNFDSINNKNYLEKLLT